MKRIIIMAIICLMMASGCQGFAGGRVAVLPTQSFVSTDSYELAFTVPVATKNTPIETIKFLSAITESGATLKISGVDYGESATVNAGIMVTPVTLKIDNDFEMPKEFTIKSLEYEALGKKRQGEVNISCYVEKPYEAPFLMGTFEVFEDTSTVVFSMQNISGKDVKILRVDCGNALSIKEHTILKGDQSEVVKEAVVIKPNEVIKQQIKFDRNTDALSQIALRFHTDSIKDLESFNMFSFGFVGTMDESLIKQALDATE